MKLTHYTEKPPDFSDGTILVARNKTSCDGRKYWEVDIAYAQDVVRNEGEEEDPMVDWQCRHWQGKFPVYFSESPQDWQYWMPFNPSVTALNSSNHNHS